MRDTIHPSELWEVLHGLVRDGTTLLLTTLYLEEADHLADEIIVIDKDKIIAAGTPTQLKDQAGAASVVVTLTRASDMDEAERLVRTCSDEVIVDYVARRLTAKASGLGDMSLIGQVIEASGIPVDDLGLKRPSLDDVRRHQYRLDQYHRSQRRRARHDGPHTGPHHRDPPLLELTSAESQTVLPGNLWTTP